MAGAGFKTFTAGSILTASDVNTYLMQQSTMVFASTTARDAAITSPSKGMQCYLTDTNRQMFYDGTLWQESVSQNLVHGVDAYRSSGNVTIPDITPTAIPFTAETIDTAGFHDNATNNTRFTVPTGLGGLYYIRAIMQWAVAGGTSAGLLYLRKNGTTNLVRETKFPFSANDASNVSTFEYLAAGDYVEAIAYHNDGGSTSKTLLTNTTSSGFDPVCPRFQMWLIAGGHV